MIDTLSQIKDAIGMDSNNFYPLLVSTIISLLPIIRCLFGYINNSRINNLLDLHRTEETDFFYIKVMIIEAVFFFVSYLMAVFIFACSGLDLNEDVGHILIIIFSFITGWLSVKRILMKLVFVRKRVLGVNAYRWLLYAPIMLYNLSLFHIDAVVKIASILFCIVEIIGLLRFQGRYIKYKYSSLNIYKNNGDKIECGNISKIKRKGDILMIEVENGKIHVDYKDISKIEYKGTELIVLKNSYGKCN